jgi:hypothetical protein
MPNQARRHNRTVADANGVTHTSPGQRPGFMGQKNITSAESAIHWQMRQAVGLRPNHIPRISQGAALGWYEPGLWPESSGR